MDGRDSDGPGPRVDPTLLALTLGSFLNVLKNSLLFDCIGFSYLKNSVVLFFMSLLQVPNSNWYPIIQFNSILTLTTCS